MSDYSTLKQRNIEHQTCVRSGCGKQSADDCLLCLDCAEDHRQRNQRSMKRTRLFRKVQLWLIR